MTTVELHSDVVKRQSSFAYTLLETHVEDILHGIVDQRIHQPGLAVEDVFEEHFREPKEFGAADKERLMFYTMVSSAFCKDPRIPKRFKAEAFELSASMLWETAFIETVESHNSPVTVDDRLELVDIGASFLRHASTLTQKDDMEKTQRLLLRSLFAQVMRDIAAGEVTEATRDELLLSLRDARSQLKFIKESNRKIGLLGEIETLQSFWNEYYGRGNKVAIPSTVRGGSGHFREDETHDIDILRQRRDDSWIVLTPIEVKRRKITDKMRERYRKSHLAHVATNGTVSISGDHREIAI